MAPPRTKKPAENSRANGMLRRSHKKSRNGCSECKQRHIKCDEKRPACANCTITDRTCTYPDTANSSPAGSRTSSTPPPSQLTIPNLVPSFAATVSDASADHEPPVNAAHIELALNFSLAIAVPDIEPEMCSKATKIALDAALDAPYLLHEILSISARHLAVTQLPSSSASHLARAVRLQNMAISQFNAAPPAVDSTTCVPKLLFSSLLGRHLLIDTLAARTDLTAFMDRYAQYVGIHRGLRAVASASWPLLMRSELAPFLSWGSSASSSSAAPGRGTQCSQLRQLIASSALPPVAADVCHRAVDQLQFGFDELTPPPEPTPAGPRCQIPFMWSIVVPREFTDLLVQMRAEALVIFAYYAVLLHHRRELWQVGDAGMYLFNLISGFLGADWAPWMAWPRTLLDA
ncbi:uncharacterized protein DNG_00079 [Cephalotrichum gorgonifer]|uniref:Zn(2)-C6 fungal-type domain-containing protein n=1 Tax=Cephalotrichum gorgonifer TaxID=2041049 RepID=A0AAE8SQF2_9PEZI|nr:uncharacterized protein DNG_00079 [Cephalotrichum gorgonifer]